MEEPVGVTWKPLEGLFKDKYINKLKITDCFKPERLSSRPYDIKKKVRPNPALHHRGLMEGIWEQLHAIQSLEEHEVQERDPIIRGPISGSLTSELVLQF